MNEQRGAAHRRSLCCDAVTPFFFSDRTERHVHSYRSTHLHVIYITPYYLFIHPFIYLFIYTGSSWKHDGTRRGRRAMRLHVTSSQTFACGHQDPKGKRLTFVETGDGAKTGGVTFKKPWPLATSPSGFPPLTASSTGVWISAAPSVCSVGSSCCCCRDADRPALIPKKTSLILKNESILF